MFHEVVNSKVEEVKTTINYKKMKNSGSNVPLGGVRRRKSWKQENLKCAIQDNIQYF